MLVGGVEGELVGVGVREEEGGTHAIREMTALVRVAAVASLRRRRACPALLIRRCFVNGGGACAWACFPPALAVWLAALLTGGVDEVGAG